MNNYVVNEKRTLTQTKRILLCGQKRVPKTLMSNYLSKKETKDLKYPERTKTLDYGSFRLGHQE